MSDDIETLAAEDERRAIMERAQLQDAYDALRAAILWLHGEYRDHPRSQFNAEPWYRKARSGCVGLRDHLARTEGPDPLSDDVIYGASRPISDHCGIQVPPFRANCVLPKGHDGPHELASSFR